MLHEALAYLHESSCNPHFAIEPSTNIGDCTKYEARIGSHCIDAQSASHKQQIFRLWAQTAIFAFC